MSRFGLNEFVTRTAQQELGQGIFELESERLLEVNLNGDAWMKHGAMVAYRGDIQFVREKILEKGLLTALKKGVSGEGARLTKMTGNGKVYLADAGKKVTVLELAGESLFVNGNDVLAFEESLNWDVKMLRKAMAMAAGGLFNVRFDGTGLLAITTHYDPLTLLVEPGRPVFTDPNATVAWSGSLTPEFKTDIQLKSLIGRGSGESIQMRFEGSGFVVIQPFEEVAFQAGTA
ncbi:MAG: hypothetical protein ACI89L_001873 [Phycisphaerales bacterium]|jgi:uncharacterized protein (AIM24 family)